MGITLDEVRALAFATDSVDVSGSALGANDGVDIGDVTVNNAGGASAVNIQDGGNSITVDGSVTVSATNLDIRALINTQDSIAIGDESTLVDMATMDSAFGVTSAGFPIMGIRQDAAGSPVSATGDAHPLVFNNDGELKVAADLTSGFADDAADSGNPIKMGGRGVDQSFALSALSASNDRFDLLGDLYRRVHINDACNVDWKVTTASIGTIQSQVAAIAMAGRKKVILQNASNNRDIYIRKLTGVTTANGIRIPSLASFELDLGESQDIFAIADGAGADLRILEAG